MVKKLLITALIMLFGTGFAVATPIGTEVTWEGMIWQQIGSGEFKTEGVPPDDIFNITTPAFPGLAQTVTATDYFQVGVDMDAGPRSAVLIADYSTGGPQVQIGLQLPFGRVGYAIGNTWNWDGLAMPTTGTNTYTFERSDTGIVSLLLDGNSIWETPTGYEMNSITHLRLGALGGTGVFTSASTQAARCLSRPRLHC